ncbi:MAG: hypothetical protein ACLFTA_00665 [Candidatus Nanohaloarchaea archaeon]
MKLKNLLIDSLKELGQRPSFFVPKLVTSFIGSIWILSALQTIKSPNMAAIYFETAIFPVIFFLGVLSPVIVAEMVKNRLGLVEAFKKTFSYFPKLFLTTLLLLAGATASVLPSYVGLAFYLYLGVLEAVFIGAVISLVLVAGLAYGIYFLPVTLVDNSAFGGLRKSFEASRQYRKEVTLLILLSFALLGLAAFSSGLLRGLGVTGFVTGRMLSSTVSTYTVILSPKLYLEDVRPSES